MRPLVLAAFFLAPCSPAWGFDEAGMIEAFKDPKDSKEGPKMPAAQPPGEEDPAQGEGEEEQEEGEDGEEAPSGSEQTGSSSSSSRRGSRGSSRGERERESPAAKEEAKQEQAAAASRRSAAGAKAQRMAQTLKAMGQNPGGALNMPGAAGFPGGAGGPRGSMGASGAQAATAVSAAGGAAGPSAAALGPGGAANPQEVSSWYGAYSNLASSRGLVPYQGADGKLAFRRKDGTPASDKEVADLRAAAAREPGALSKYPDFFSHISRGDYGRLREEYARDSGRAQFKDVGMTQDQRRDLVWEKSCEKISGACNPLAVEASYKKDEFVKPKTARSLWQSLAEEMGIEDEKEEPQFAAMVGSRRFSTNAAPPRWDSGGSGAADDGPAVSAAGTGAFREAGKAAGGERRGSGERESSGLSRYFSVGDGEGKKSFPVGWALGLLGALALAAGIKLRS